MNAEYVRILRSELSAVKAYRNSRLVYSTIELSDSSCWMEARFRAGGNFLVTEVMATPGSPIYELKLDNGDTFVMEYDSNHPDTLIMLKHAFRWDFEDSTTVQSFVRVSTWGDNLLSEALLAGEYVDSNGSKYSFSDSGKATWPDKTFKYVVSSGNAPMDYISGDIIDDNSRDICLGFKRLPTELQFFVARNAEALYSTEDGQKGDGVFDSIPYLKLKRIGPSLRK